MGHGIRALALGALVAATSTAANAKAWQVDGYYHFWMEVVEIGFSGESRLEYSARLTEDDFAGEEIFFAVEGPGRIIGWDSINGGPLVPMLITADVTPAVALGVDDWNFLMPIGGINWLGSGQFDWFRVEGEGSYAWFTHDGVFYDCDFEAGCRPGPDPGDEFSSYAFIKWWETDGTVTLVPDPPSFALIGLALFGLGMTRLRRT